MSRRIKLIIAALFLVLLIIPAVYFFTAWEPADALEARLIPVPGLGAEGAMICPFLIEVKNTSHITFGVFDATIHLPSQRVYARLDIQYHEHDRRLPRPNNGPLYPGETRRYEVYALVPGAGYGPYVRRPMGGATLEYEWTSQVKYHTQTVWQWLHAHLPKSLAEQIPYPSDSTSTTTLQLP